MNARISQITHDKSKVLMANSFYQLEYKRALSGFFTITQGNWCHNQDGPTATPDMPQLDVAARTFKRMLPASGSDVCPKPVALFRVTAEVPTANQSRQSVGLTVADRSRPHADGHG